MSLKEKGSTLLSKITLASTHSFSKAFLDYIGGHEALKTFYHRFPSRENFGEQLKERNFPKSTRTVVAQVLRHQYATLECSELTEKNIRSINEENTFTITTGHQLNIFTGPLYFIYKIITVINACQALRSMYPAYHFVPVYWMASEDHDFEEISHFRFNGKKFSWKTDQTGAVGRFDPRELRPLLEEIIGMPDLFNKAYLGHTQLSDAVRYYVNALFGDHGLVVIDADDSRLKNLLKPVITEDLFRHTVKSMVSHTSAQLEKTGYKAQVYPREINFFYLLDNIRSRIVTSETGFEVMDTGITFTPEALKNEVDEFPERFSPNVVIRPLYQELILPDLAYVGGPSELIYWLQLKGVFEHFKTPFPILLPRNFAGILSPGIQRKIRKAGLSYQEIFMPEEVLIKTKVTENAPHELTLKKALEKLNGVFHDISDQALKVDPTLAPMVAAERKKAARRIQRIEHKLLKAEKRNQEVLVNRIYAIREALSPGGVLQERKDNFLNFYIRDGHFIDSCLKSLDPFDFRFHLISAYE